MWGFLLSVVRYTVMDIVFVYCGCCLGKMVPWNALPSALCNTPYRLCMLLQCYILLCAHLSRKSLSLWKLSGFWSLFLVLFKKMPPSNCVFGDFYSAELTLIQKMHVQYLGFWLGFNPSPFTFQLILMNILQKLHFKIYFKSKKSYLFIKKNPPVSRHVKL